MMISVSLGLWGFRGFRLEAQTSFFPSGEDKGKLSTKSAKSASCRVEVCRYIMYGKISQVWAKHKKGILSNCATP